MARVVFMGTPEFGVPVLEALARQHEVAMVVTQPDRAAGRGRQQMAASAVKQAAMALGLPILQPASLRRDTAAVEALRQVGAEVLVIAAFGQILRPNVLAIPPRGCIGVHASLLPKYRGAAPIAAAILNGESETGVTLMLTDAGMDTGAIIAQASLTIAPDDTTATLSARLARLGADLLIETLPAWLAGEITPRPQDDALATAAPPIDKSQGRIDWRRSAAEIDRMIRAYTPWPGAFCLCEGKSLKVLRARPWPDWQGDAQPGVVLQTERGLGVATGEGLLLLDQLQLEGKKALDARPFAQGRRGFIQSILE